jgi:uncharacterized membrane protein YukC
MEPIIFILFLCLIIAVGYIIFIKYKYVLVEKNDPILIPQEMDFLKDDYEQRIQNMM